MSDSGVVSEELKMREEKCQRLQNENRHLLESLAIMLSTPARFVESSEGAVKERVRELLTEHKDKAAVIEIFLPLQNIWLVFVFSKLKVFVRN